MILSTQDHLRAMHEAFIRIEGGEQAHTTWFECVQTNIAAINDGIAMSSAIAGAETKLLAHAELLSFDEKTDETTVAKSITPLMQAENKKGASEMFMRYAELVSEAGPAR